MMAAPAHPSVIRQSRAGQGLTATVANHASYALTRLNLSNITPGNSRA
ncbi:MAG: hypothetical protein HY784_16480 [Chloroflexi bacterium]|nr:hypothetical protein [Chloroflexota bacterium]